jgi:hypothetical protein
MTASLFDGAEMTADLVGGVKMTASLFNERKQKARPKPGLCF